MSRAGSDSGLAPTAGSSGNTTTGDPSSEPRTGPVPPGVAACGFGDTPPATRAIGCGGETTLRPGGTVALHGRKTPVPSRLTPARRGSPPPGGRVVPRSAGQYGNRSPGDVGLQGGTSRLHPVRRTSVPRTRALPTTRRSKPPERSPSAGDPAVVERTFGIETRGRTELELAVARLLGLKATGASDSGKESPSGSGLNGPVEASAQSVLKGQNLSIGGRIPPMCDTCGCKEKKKP